MITKLKKLGFMAVLIVLTLSFIPMIVRADPWSAIDSGYAVTTNHHGEDIDITKPIDPPLRAKVGFKDENGVYEVRVDLRDPDGNVVDSDTVEWPADFDDGTSPKGADIEYAWTKDLEPNTGWVVGHYSVKAYFFSEDGKELANTEDLVAMKATTVMAVPEVPIGTITILITMLASLAIFARKRV